MTSNPIKPFTKDPDDAERARGIVEPTPGLKSSQMGPQNSSSFGNSNKDPSTLFKEFGKDTKIWELYLENAEGVAKEHTTQWNSWLDSILIFGLFTRVGFN
ncbi:hypothetical protein BDQ17DRAFT_1325754 [Cyathus striatus]|nr:hypothetical protein BDQ17DRAFT_1325754 [Cyathus striatus]